MKTIPTVRLSRHEAVSAEEKASSPIPEHTLKLVELALSNFQTRDDWERVRKAILAPCNSEPESTPAPVQDRFLSTEELCTLLHVSRVTIFRYVRAGKLKSHKLGRRNLYSVAEVMAAVKGGAADA